MYNIYNIIGITFLIFSLLAAFFAQEELMLSCGIVALYCAIIIRNDNRKEQEINNV